MRSIALLLLCSCAAKPEWIEPEPASWQVVQHEFFDRRAGEAWLRPGKMVYLAPEPPAPVLAVEPVPSQVAVGDVVRVRAGVRSDAPMALYRVTLANRSAHLRPLGPISADVARGRRVEFVLTCDLSGPAQLEVTAVPLVLKGIE